MSNELTLKPDNQSLLAPENFEHQYRIASMMAKSEMVPKAFQNKPQDILLACEMGRALGLSPLSAIQNIAVINGKPSLYGDAVLAVCAGHPDFEDIKEEPIIGKDGQVEGYVCTVKRRGRSPTFARFTKEDATIAGLWARTSPWKQYPQRMLQMRARGFALRDAFADALGGVRVAEEVGDYRELKEINPQSKNKDAEEELMGLIDDAAE